MHRKFQLTGPFLLFLLITFIVSNFVLDQIRRFEKEITISLQSSNIISKKTNRSKPHKITVKGVYLTAYTAANSQRREEIKQLLRSTELNSVIIDIKDYTGYVLYQSDLPLVKQFKTQKNILGNLRDIVQDFKTDNIYVIARQTVFQDPVLAIANPQWAIRTKDNLIWKDFKGLSWVDPTKKEVWKYNVAIANEVIQSGFDEVNFDYIRFPSDGPIKQAQYADTVSSKNTIIGNFLEFVHTQLKDEPAYLSADLFGMVMVSHDFDLNIGQTLQIALNKVDYICPMMYPSHYPRGYLGLNNPADFPYEVILDGLIKSQNLFTSTTTALRPWIQAFNLGAVYDGEKIRAQIRAIEDSNYAEGWMLWNASNRYTKNGLHS